MQLSKPKIVLLTAAVLATAAILIAGQQLKGEPIKTTDSWVLDMDQKLQHRLFEAASLAGGTLRTAFSHSEDTSLILTHNTDGSVASWIQVDSRPCLMPGQEQAIYLNNDGQLVFHDLLTDEQTAVDTPVFDNIKLRTFDATLAPYVALLVEDNYDRHELLIMNAATRTLIDHERLIGGSNYRLRAVANSYWAIPKVTEHGSHVYQSDTTAEDKTLQRDKLDPLPKDSAVLYTPTSTHKWVFSRTTNKETGFFKVSALHTEDQQFDVPAPVGQHMTHIVRDDILIYENARGHICSINLLDGTTSIVSRPVARKDRTYIRPIHDNYFVAYLNSEHQLAIFSIDDNQITQRPWPNE